MPSVSASTPDLLESNQLAEPHCARCGERLERGRAFVRSAPSRRTRKLRQLRQLCVDCAFIDYAFDEATLTR